MKLRELFKKSVPLTGRTIDMTRSARGWGHNFSIVKDNRTTARFAIWVTPRPKVGDKLEYEVSQGLVSVVITSVEWTRNVDDMYFIDVKALTLNGEDVQ